ncbi:VWA domain-containing protein [bacterium]|nr:VWA domain-containing protein [bacterium]
MRDLRVGVFVLFLVLFFSVLPSWSQQRGLEITEMRLVRKGTPHIFTKNAEGDFNLFITCTEDTGAVDIVFVLDTTGSMDSLIGAARANIVEFAETMAATGYDCSFGIVTYGDGFNLPHGGNLTTDIGTFVSWMTMGSWGGGDAPETALDAIMAAVDSMHWRPGALRVIILLTDACFCDTSSTCYDCVSMWGGEEVVNILLEQAIMFFAVTTWPVHCQSCALISFSNWFYQDFPESTGGSWYDFSLGFTSIYAEIIPLLGTFQVIQVDVANNTGEDLDSISAFITYGSCIEILYGDNPMLRTDVPAGDTTTFFWRVNYEAGCTGEAGCFQVVVSGDTYVAEGSGCMYVPNCWCTPTVAENIHPDPGVWTACNPQDITIGIYDDDIGVDENTITLVVNEDTLEYPSEPGMSYLNDTLIFSPDTDEFASGDSVFYSLIDAEDAGGCSLAAPVSGWFVVDLDPPVFEGEYPPDGEIVGGISTDISVHIWDDLAGLDTSSLVMLIDGTDSFYIGGSEALYYDQSDSTLHFNPVGIYTWSVGDTVDVCVYASDFVSTEYCGPNSDGMCWSFTIDFLHLWFPDTTLYPGDDIQFPLLTENPGRFMIRTYDLWVEYNPAVVYVNDIVATGSASSGFTVSWDTAGSQLHIYAESTSPMSDVDTFVFIDFHIRDDAPGASYTPVILSSAVLDSGRVGYYGEDGMILILWSQTQWLKDLVFYGYDGEGGYLEPEVLSIGCADLATEGFDPTLDLIILPPPPTKTEVYHPLDDPSYPAITKLKRDYRNTYELPITWHIVTVDEPGSLYWNPDNWPDGIIMLNDVIDMKRNSTYLYASNETLTITYSQPLPDTGNVDFCDEWTLASLPTAITVPDWVDFLENVTAGPFEFDAEMQTYIISDIPRIGFGFWVYSDESSAYHIGGIPLTTVTIPIYPGWNLVGSVSETAWFETDPPNLILPGNVYGYNCETHSYEPVTEFVPGRGYWVLSIGTGTMTIHP